MLFQFNKRQLSSERNIIKIGDILFVFFVLFVVSVLRGEFSFNNGNLRKVYLERYPTLDIRPQTIKNCRLTFLTNLHNKILIKFSFLCLATDIQRMLSELQTINHKESCQWF